jgi:hypothetical protein
MKIKTKQIDAERYEVTVDGKAVGVLRREERTHQVIAAGRRNQSRGRRTGTTSSVVRWFAEDVSPFDFTRRQDAINELIKAAAA